MKTNHLVAFVVIGAGALYLYMRSRDAAFESAHTMLPFGGTIPNGSPTPTAPSPLGLNVGGGTNPITQILSGVTSVFTRLLSKQPGNAPASVSTPSTVGLSQVGWTVRPQDSYIPPPPLNPSWGTAGQRLPNLGDPNYAQWSYLGNTVQDQTWYLPGAYIGDVPFDAGAAGGGIPDLSWTLDPATLGYDPTYIPPPPLSGSISIVSVE